MQFSPEGARYLAARGGSWDKSGIKDIPLLIVVSYRLTESVRDELVLGSVWMAVESMLLGATDEWLGSCVYTFLNREEELKRMLHGSQLDRIACLIQLGHSKGEPKFPSRKPMDEIESFEHF